MKAREPVIAALRSVVEQDHRLVFAYIYGSFIRGEAFRDVDVGIYLRDTSEDPFAVSFLAPYPAAAGIYQKVTWFATRGNQRCQISIIDYMMGPNERKT